MRHVYAIIIAGLLIGSLTGCGVTTKGGGCKDYRPLGVCDDDYVYVCDTTDDGCEQCSCVPEEDEDSYDRR